MAASSRHGAKVRHRPWGSGVPPSPPAVEVLDERFGDTDDGRATESGVPVTVWPVCENGSGLHPAGHLSRGSTGTHEEQLK
jgi:hypothetical protein